MRVRHTLWKVSNGYLLVPEDCDSYLRSGDAPGCYVFKTLKEFSDWKPKRKRRSKYLHKSLPEEQTNANLN